MGTEIPRHPKPSPDFRAWYITARGIPRVSNSVEIIKTNCQRGTLYRLFRIDQGCYSGRKELDRRTDPSHHYPVSFHLSCSHLTAYKPPLVYDRTALCVSGRVAERVLRNERWLQCATESIEGWGKELRALSNQYQSSTM